jgi:hypothetical protein
MVNPDDTSRTPSAEWLPPDVLEALAGSAVAAIRALQMSQGIGLYEAKLVIDGYLEKHPEHPLAVLMSQSQARSANIVEAVAPSKSGQVASSERGQPLSVEALPQRIPPPEVYLIARAGIGNDGWFSVALKACLGIVVDSSSVQVVDEEQGSERGDLIGAAVKISEPLSSAALDRLLEVLKRELPPEVSFRLLHGATRSELSILPEELSVEYFRKEFAVDSRMVHHSTSCAKLTHLPTQVSSRSTDHRSRIANYEEALFLLASLLRNRG